MRQTKKFAPLGLVISFPKRDRYSSYTTGLEVRADVVTITSPEFESDTSQALNGGRQVCVRNPDTSQHRFNYGPRVYAHATVYETANYPQTTGSYYANGTEWDDETALTTNLKALQKIKRGMQRFYDLDGQPRDLGEWFTRFGKSLGVAWFLVDATNGKHRSHDDPYRFIRSAEAAKLIQDRVDAYLQERQAKAEADAGKSPLDKQLDEAEEDAKNLLGWSFSP
jgi:hypothetical protein